MIRYAFSRDEKRPPVQTGPTATGDQGGLEVRLGLTARVGARCLHINRYPRETDEAVWVTFARVRAGHVCGRARRTS